MTGRHFFMNTDTSRLIPGDKICVLNEGYFPPSAPIKNSDILVVDSMPTYDYADDLKFKYTINCPDNYIFPNLSETLWAWSIKAGEYDPELSMIGICKLSTDKQQTSGYTGYYTSYYTGYTGSAADSRYRKLYNDSYGIIVKDITMSPVKSLKGGLLSEKDWDEIEKKKAVENLKNQLKIQEQKSLADLRREKINAEVDKFQKEVAQLSLQDLPKDYTGYTGATGNTGDIRYTGTSGYTHMSEPEPYWDEEDIVPCITAGGYVAPPLSPIGYYEKQLEVMLKKKHNTGRSSKRRIGTNSTGPQ